MPAALYQEMNDPNGPIKNMIVVTTRGTFQSAEQFHMPLLCQACEIRFQKGGENWTLENRYRSDGSFPLRDLPGREPGGQLYVHASMRQGKSLV